MRARYWNEAFHVYESSKWIGAGAGAYVVARTRYRTDRLVVRHAHGYGVQTLADLGLIGVGAVAAGRGGVAGARRSAPPGCGRRDRGLPFDPERIGLLTLATVVIVFAAHSLIDWTWFVPGNAVVALLCAGWVAGRPGLRERAAAPLAARPASAGRGASACAASGRRRSAARRPRCMVAALAASWAALQPVRVGARRRPRAGRRRARQVRPRRAAARRPAPTATRCRSSRCGCSPSSRTRAATPSRPPRYLEQAVVRQPANTEAWRRLGRYRLTVLGDAEGAVQAFRAAYYLDPAALQTASDLVEATRVLRAKK